MSGARFIDDGRVIFSHWSPVDGSTVRLYDPVLKRVRFGTRYLQRPFWFESGRSGVFRNAITERFNNYADLYVLDLETKKIQNSRMNLYLRQKSTGARSDLTPGEVLFVE